jgi:hypothetical protein
MTDGYDPEQAKATPVETARVYPHLARVPGSVNALKL